LRALPGRAGLPSVPRPRERLSCDRAAPRRDLVRPTAARRGLAVPPLSPAVPGGGTPLRPLRLRPRALPQPLRRQGGPHAARCAPPLLLLYAHALRVGPCRRLCRCARRARHPAPLATRRRPAPPVGSANRDRPRLRRDLPAYRRADPARLGPRGRRDPPAG